ncbi:MULTISPECIES: polysaccharide biosynthesis protein [Aequorivita]|uniref:Polysaccharide biosynthesis protein n=1 Tax=Aequorivita iocasae TaxID=2803865 RepID=A0ABX7DQD7_9FLAO|nr:MULTISPECIES: nucleoside-diphosphate sugar epimerase/dehydratase [Aequorivita]QQX76032.1 polysaccharide biosynthesis protein [Aequorivita iocasae]UCA55492.1 polysaccharide biosynthesis protein [Aequorivita sp. F7]
MRTRTIGLLNRRYLPRWAVLMLDIIICLISVGFTYLILEGTPLKFQTVWPFSLRTLFVLGTNAIFFYIFRTYSGIVRHSTFTDIFRVAAASFLTGITVVLFNTVYYLFEGEKIFLTTGVLLYMFFSFTLMLFLRIAVKEAYQYIRRMNIGKVKKRVLIVGMDNQTINLGRALTSESDQAFQLVGFITEDFTNKSLNVLGKPVFLTSITKDSIEFAFLLEKHRIDGVLMVRDSLSVAETNEIVEACLANKIQVFNMPSVENWNQQQNLQTQIKHIEIEDLLDRYPIEIDSAIIKNDLEDKTILVTGGAGSIGSEIVRQLALFNPRKIVVLDNAESPLYEMELYLGNTFPDLEFSTILADVRNIDRLEMIFAKFKFDLVFHAAAYKHVPLIEKNPYEAVGVNILGTVNLANLAVQHGIDKFVMISTDKAVNPTNVMGASKRAAEMYVQSLQEKIGTHTRFITTRFGNVLGSNGSVIPHFRKQIEAGGPVTVTHKDIIRYFMTIPEACQLVLQAGTMGKGGEIYVFDMGKPVRILDMAERMIKLSGFQPYKDIDIQFTGLRPGEKLYEELLSDTAQSLPTFHSKIMVSKIPAEDFYAVNEKIQAIIKATQQNSRMEVVLKIKELVPEFISQNSEFQHLDLQHQN